jgi:hypothetical protein
MTHFDAFMPPALFKSANNICMTSRQFYFARKQPME